MNKQGKGKIEWCDFSWSPITGCLNTCHYCYARKIYQRFKRSFNPEFHPERLIEPIKKFEPSKIFVCSVSDFWGEGVKQEWRDRVYKVMEFCRHHTFFILTKQPQNIDDADRIPKNVWVGTSVTESKDWQRPLYLSQRIKNNKKFISYEPILGPILFKFNDYDWIIMGALTGCGTKNNPNIEWIQNIMQWAKIDNNNILIFMKKNLKPIWQGKLIQEWPKL